MILGNWRFSDNNLGYDFSGWGNHGVVSNVTQGRPLAAGGRYSAYFDNASIVVPDSKSTRIGMQSFTVSAWIDAKADGTIVESDDRWGMGIQDGELHAYIRDRFGNFAEGSLAPIIYDAPHYIVVTFDRKMHLVSAYVDGVEFTGFSSAGLKKLAHDFEDTTIGAGSYGSFLGRIDDVTIGTGIIGQKLAELTFMKNFNSLDFIEYALGKNPIMFLSHDTEGEYSPDELSMNMFDIQSDNFNVSAFQSSNDIVWSQTMNGVSTDHTGYLSLTPRHQTLLNDAPESVPGERYSGWSPPVTIISTAFAESTVEFVASSLSDASGIIINAEFETGRYVIRASNGTLLFEEMDGGSVTDYVAVDVDDWSHVAVVFSNEALVYVDGVFRGSTELSRGGLIGMSMLGGSNNPFTGMIGPVVAYPHLLSHRSIRDNYDVAYAGKLVRRITSSGGVFVNGSDLFRSFYYDWVMTPA